MGNLLYVVAVICIIFWALGVFVYSVGGIIHLLLVLAVASVLMKVIKGNKNAV